LQDSEEIEADQIRLQKKGQMHVLRNLEGPKVRKTSKAQTDEDLIYKEHKTHEKEESRRRQVEVHRTRRHGNQLEEIEKDKENQCNYQEGKDL